jgi:hypothetical protein
MLPDSVLIRKRELAQAATHEAVVQCEELAEGAFDASLAAFLNAFSHCLIEKRDLVVKRVRVQRRAGAPFRRR